MEDTRRRVNTSLPHLASIALGGLEATAPQAAVRRAAAAADDLQLFFGAIGSVQQLLDELLQPHFGIGLTRRRLLEELVDLGDFPKRQRRGRAALFFAYFKVNLAHWRF